MPDTYGARPLIGVCMPHAEFRYFVLLAAALESLADRDGFDTLHAFSRTDGDTELRRVQLLARQHVTGLLLLPGAAPQVTLDWLAEAGLPTVILDRPIDDRRFDQAIVDSRGAMQEVGSRLIALGHRSLLFVTGEQRLLISQRRIEGLRLAIRASGQRVVLRLLDRGAAREDEIAEMITGVMREDAPPTAIIGTNTFVTGWILAALRRLKLRIPDEVSLFAADEPDWARLVCPALATIRSPVRVIAGHAWRMLRTAMGGEVRRARRVAVEAELREGGSIGPAPGAPRRVT